jgi:hypothetical protein
VGAMTPRPVTTTRRTSGACRTGQRVAREKRGHRPGPGRNRAGGTRRLRSLVAASGERERRTSAPMRRHRARRQRGLRGALQLGQDRTAPTGGADAPSPRHRPAILTGATVVTTGRGRGAGTTRTTNTSPPPTTKGWTTKKAPTHLRVEAPSPCAPVVEGGAIIPLRAGGDEMSAKVCDTGSASRDRPHSVS